MVATVLVVGEVSSQEYRPVYDRYRKKFGQVRFMRIGTESLLVDSECYEMFFLSMGWSAIDMDTIANNHRIVSDEPEYCNVYEAVRSEIGQKYGLDYEKVRAVVFDFYIGWTPYDFANVLLAHIPLREVGKHIYPVKLGKILLPGGREYNSTYHAIADKNNATLEF